MKQKQAHSAIKFKIWRNRIMRLGATEIILIIILALVLFGGGKLANVGKSLGKSIKDFKNEIKDSSAEKKDAIEEIKA